MMVLIAIWWVSFLAIILLIVLQVRGDYLKDKWADDVLSEIIEEPKSEYMI